MGKILMSGTYGGVASDDITAKREDIIAGKTAITADSDDEIVEGTLPDHKDTVNAVSVGMASNGTHYNMHCPKGAYRRTDLGDNGGAGVITTPLAELRRTIGYTNPAKVLSDTTIAGQAGTIPIQGGSTIVPGTGNKTAIGGGRYTSGNIIVSGDPNLIPANIKKGARIFGVNGTHDGFIPGPMDIYNRGTWGAGYGIGDVSAYANVGNMSITNDTTAIKVKQSGVPEDTVKSNGISFRIKKPINLLSYRTINFITSGLLAYNWGYNGSSGASLALKVFNDSSFSTVVASSSRDLRYASPNYSEHTFSLDISNVSILGYISIDLSNISDYSSGGYLYGQRINLTSYIHKIWFT